MMSNAVDFSELVTKVEVNKVGSDTLSILGGQCGPAEALELVQQWPTLMEMPHRIWEYASEIVFEKDTLPNEIQWLERGRLFGPGGDLSLRREEGMFLWYFVGPSGIKAPDNLSGVEDFWVQGEAGAKFYENMDTALLWGEHLENSSQLNKADSDRRERLWFDDRTASAKLHYADDLTGRVQVNYRTYSRAGRVEFVWLVGLSEWKGEE